MKGNLVFSQTLKKFKLANREAFDDMEKVYI